MSLPCSSCGSSSSIESSTAGAAEELPTQKHHSKIDGLGKGKFKQQLKNSKAPVKGLTFASACRVTTG